MPKGETLQVTLNARPSRGNARDFYAPSPASLASEVLQRDDYGSVGRGLRGRNINHEETAAIVRYAHAHGTDARDVIVQRFSSKDKQRKLNVGQVRERLTLYQTNKPKAIAKELYREAREEEVSDRRDKNQFRTFFWPLMLSRAVARPVGKLKNIVKGLERQKPDPYSLLDIQDAVTSAVRLNFPEYDNVASKPANILLNILRWGPIPYITSAIPGVHFLDAIFDAPQVAADMAMGKGYIRTNQDGIGLVFDLIYTPGFNLGIIGKSLDRMNNIVRRGSLSLAQEAISDPTSPYYRHRVAVAQAVLSANSFARNTAYLPKFSEEISMAAVQKRIDAHNLELENTSWWGKHIGFKARRLAKRASHLKWQRKVAELMDLAKQVPLPSEPVQPVPPKSPHVTLLDKAGNWLINKLTH